MSRFKNVSEGDTLDLLLLKMDRLNYATCKSGNETRLKHIMHIMTTVLITVLIIL
jgi:hypothetical protein